MDGHPSPIRDLILKLDAVARVHAAYPQVCHVMTNLRDHLSALARCEEINQRDTRAEDLATLKPIKPHLYQPDALAQGDCRECGHGPDRPWHYRR
jgi:hypothetical protein